MFMSGLYLSLGQYTIGSIYKHYYNHSVSHDQVKQTIRVYNTSIFERLHAGK